MPLWSKLYEELEKLNMILDSLVVDGRSAAAVQHLYIIFLHLRVDTHGGGWKISEAVVYVRTKPTARRSLDGFRTSIVSRAASFGIVASVSALAPVVRIRRRLEEESEQRPLSQRVSSPGGPAAKSEVALTWWWGRWTARRPRTRERS